MAKNSSDYFQHVIKGFNKLNHSHFQCKLFHCETYASPFIKFKIQVYEVMSLNQTLMMQ